MNDHQFALISGALIGFILGWVGGAFGGYKMACSLYKPKEGR
jgi:hypothetical protein